MDGTAKATEVKDWRYHIDLSDLPHEANKKRVMAMLERHQDMWGGHLGQIKGPPRHINIKLGICPIKQLPYRQVRNA